jgi:hypothetical protein
MITEYSVYFYISGQKKHNCRVKLTFDNPNDKDAIKFAETFRLLEHVGFMIFQGSNPVATWTEGGETRIIRNENNQTGN